jgi:hypothetical protein
VRARVGEGKLVRACVRPLCEWMGVGARALSCACAREGLLIQYATRRHHIACVLSGYTTFLDIVQGGSNMTGTNCDLFTHK